MHHVHVSRRTGCFQCGEEAARRPRRDVLSVDGVRRLVEIGPDESGRAAPHPPGERLLPNQEAEIEFELIVSYPCPCPFYATRCSYLREAMMATPQQDLQHLVLHGPRSPSGLTSSFSCHHPRKPQPRSHYGRAGRNGPPSPPSTHRIKRPRRKRQL